MSHDTIEEYLYAPKYKQLAQKSVVLALRALKNDLGFGTKVVFNSDDSGRRYASLTGVCCARIDNDHCAATLRGEGATFQAAMADLLDRALYPESQMKLKADGLPCLCVRGAVRPRAKFLVLRPH